MRQSNEDTAGIVLAGGKSSRMGENKALMRYSGMPMIRHMENLLRDAGCADVHIGGDVPGYDGIPDAVRHDGPARAMRDLLEYFTGRYHRLLFVPVDMPLIEVKSLQHLMNQNGNTYFSGYPLPACLETGVFAVSDSVRGFLTVAGALALDLPQPWKAGMANINTKKEWEELQS